MSFASYCQFRLAMSLGDVAESRCPPVPMLQHATPSTTKMATNGTLVEYTCNYGYNINTDVHVTSRRCNGRTWTPAGASCQGMLCTVLTVETNTIYLQFVSNYARGTNNITCNIVGYDLFICRLILWVCMLHHYNNTS